jgi:hypothetical protein
VRHVVRHADCSRVGFVIQQYDREAGVAVALPVTLSGTRGASLL